MAKVDARGEQLLDLKTEAAAIIAALEGAAPHHLVDLGKDAAGVERKGVAIRPSHGVYSLKPFLDEYRTFPERRIGTAKFTDLRGFVEHVKRFSDKDSVVFAKDDMASPSLVAVLDYHRAGAAGQPQNGQHRSSYAFPLSDEWKAWTAKSGVVMSQLDFAKFIEDRICDVADPHNTPTAVSAHDWAKKIRVKFGEPAQILELSRGLSAKVSHFVRAHHDVGNGDTTLSFSKSADDPNGQPLDVPGGFLVTIPVFKREDLFPVPIRLRYRIEEKVTWTVELARIEQVFEVALSEALSAVESSTGLPVLRGSPEGTP
jgi:uncharacterized protein YfdQ (DUF2303 family)